MKLRLEKDFTTTDTKITKKSSDIPCARSAKDAKFRKFFSVRLCVFAGNFLRVLGGSNGFDSLRSGSSDVAPANMLYVLQSCLR
jgi:hypothetical protein